MVDAETLSACTGRAIHPGSNRAKRFASVVTYLEDGRGRAERDKVEDQKDDYRISARDYLARARERLMAGKKAALFHAALELRYCIEARQAEHLEGQTKPAKSFNPFVWARMLEPSERFTLES